MAGRGTDIVLGEGVSDLGGLHVMGTERHESRRVDNQLRGRSGRQGDPGSSRFYLSLEDDLMRIFGSDRITSIMERLGMEEGQDIQHPLITRAIATAQKRVETHNFEIRKQLLKYDDIMNKQRTVIYDRRNEVLDADDLQDYIRDIMDEVVEEHLGEYVFSERQNSEWDMPGLNRWLQIKYLVKIKESDMSSLKTIDEVREHVVKALHDNYKLRESLIGKDQLTDITKYMILSAIDRKWKDHLYAMDQLREAVGFRAYGQKDPLIEYQHEGFQMFSTMISQINDEILEYLFKMQFVAQPSENSRNTEALNFTHPDQFVSAKSPGVSEAGAGARNVRQPANAALPIKRDAPKVGRNDPCPCGSGLKYKKCCG